MLSLLVVEHLSAAIKAANRITSTLAKAAETTLATTNQAAIQATGLSQTRGLTVYKARSARSYATEDNGRGASGTVAHKTGPFTTRRIEPIDGSASGMANNRTSAFTG